MIRLINQYITTQQKTKNINTLLLRECQKKQPQFNKRLFCTTTTIKTINTNNNNNNNIHSDREIKDIIITVEKELGINELDNWHNINITQIFKDNNNYNKQTTTTTNDSTNTSTTTATTQTPTNSYSNSINKLQIIFRDKFENSFYDLLKFVYPNHEWNKVKLVQSILKCKNYWKNSENLDTFIQYFTNEVVGFDNTNNRNLKDKSNYTNDNEMDNKYLSQWYRVKKDHFLKSNSRAIISPYNDSVYSFLSTYYPNYKFLPWLFTTSPKNFWKSIENQKLYLQWLGKQLGFTEFNQWYGIKKHHFINNSGNSLLLLYGGSPPKVILEVFKDQYNWNVWKFQSLPVSVISETNNNNQSLTPISNNDDNQDKLKVLREFFEYAGSYYKVKEMKDWYRVSNAQIQFIGGSQLVKTHGGLFNCLEILFPNEKWNYHVYSQPGKKSSQRLLSLYLNDLFLNNKNNNNQKEEKESSTTRTIEIFEDYRHPHLKYETLSNHSFHLDFYIPQLNLAFEYQGKQHYTTVPRFGDTMIYQNRDNEKRIICKKNNITIIEIPFWWDNQIESLIGTIITHLPNLKSNLLNNYNQYLINNNNNNSNNNTSDDNNNDTNNIKFLPIPNTPQKISNRKKAFNQQ